MTTEIRIDWDGISSSLLTGATAGLIAASKYTERQAKKYAPVRAIFKRDRAPKGVLAGNGGSADSFDYSRWRRARPRNRRIDLPASASYPLHRGPNYGNSNSFIPVLHYQAREGSVVLTGDMRRFSPTARALSPNAQVYKSVNRQGARATRIDPNVFLSAAGRAEAKSGRAVYRSVTKATFETIDGKIVRVPVKTRDYVRLGGRLRGEIFAAPPQREKDQLVSYVISPVPYGKPQEFGSRHNRAHPFMRPALYDTRRVLVAEVAKGIRFAFDRPARAGSGMR